MLGGILPLMEKIVNVRLSWFLEHHGVFTNAQCGFRKHRSSADHILALDTEIRASFIQKKHLGTILGVILGVRWRHRRLLDACAPVLRYIVTFSRF